MRRGSFIGLSSLSFAVAALSLAAATPSAHAQASCGSSTGPDVIVGEMIGWTKWGTVGSITGYTFGTTSCNFGNAVLPWIGNSTHHPVIGMNAYRLKTVDGSARFEQIGMSWVKHGWAASHDNLCCTCINPNNFYALGIGCSDAYDAGTNGSQGGFHDSGEAGNPLVSGLGPRSDVNPYTGAFPWPYTTQGATGDAIYKRLQINNNDLDPAQNAGAVYFAEGQYISPDEPLANAYNNLSYKRFTVGAISGGGYPLSFGVAPIQRQKSAIEAWPLTDPNAKVVLANVPGEGRFLLAYSVTRTGVGIWHYEYAIFNMNSDRCAREFTVPVVPGTLTSNVGFHDVPYHSGEAYDGADWPQIPLPGPVRWATSEYAVNPNANALRWGTLYNFRFDAETPPKNVNVTLGLFKPGTPATLNIPAKGPSRRGDTNGDDVVNVDDLLNIITGWGRCPSPPATCPGDLNGDGQVNVDDLLMVITYWG